MDNYYSLTSYEERESFIKNKKIEFGLLFNKNLVYSDDYEELLYIEEDFNSREKWYYD